MEEEMVLESLEGAKCAHCEAELGDDFENIFECEMDNAEGHWICGDCYPIAEDAELECPWAGDTLPWH